MTHYLDTSLVIAALTPDTSTEVVHAWLADRTHDVLGVSDWTVTEIASALSMKIRLGHLNEGQRRDVGEVLATWLDASLERVPLPRAAFDDAARLLRRHETGLRAGDALHLATSGVHGACLVTLDRRLAGAGATLGLDAVLVTARRGRRPPLRTARLPAIVVRRGPEHDAFGLDGRVRSRTRGRSVARRSRRRLVRVAD